MKSMQLAALAAGGGLLLWFGLLYPLVPRTTLGWALAIGAGAFIGLWVLAAALAIGWLRKQSRHKLACNLLAAIVALSVGTGVFLVVANAQAIISANFSYFAR